MIFDSAALRSLLCAIAFASVTAIARAAPLPLHLDLSTPFPQVTLQAPEVERIAPGIEYADYELLSDDGPISVHVVAADLSAQGVRIGAVLAGDMLTSGGETVTSMAQRTNAVAGINGDYFDIGSTNRPTNIVVRDGTLLHTPRKRYALAILRSGSAHFTEFSFVGSATIGTQTVPVSSINELPWSSTTVSILTPAFGPTPQVAGYTLVALTPTTGTPPLATYRVDGFAQTSDGHQPAGYYLVVGSQATSIALPNAGDALTVAGTLSPIPLDQLAAAIGGGPLILYDGAWFDDPDGPRGGEFDTRIPCSGAAIESDGTLLIVEVDGRQPQESIGLTRPQFSELMRALGAQDAIALDGGGSSELSVRLPGEDGALLQSSPSDGKERAVADGVFFYNDSPIGNAVALAAQPVTLRAYPGARVPLQVTAVDANEHPEELPAALSATVEPSTLGTVDGGSFVAASPGSGTIVLRSGSLEGSVAVNVVAAPSRIVISPPNANVDPGASLMVSARAFDANGYEVALPAQLPWKATSGTIDALGTFVSGTRDAVVALTLGGASASTRITVGTRESALAQRPPHFLSIPAGGSGSVTQDASCSGCVRLTYALGATERAAYAIFDQPLPAGTVGLGFDLQDDGSGAMLRVALRNAMNEQVLITATTLVRSGKRHVVVRFPSEAAQPLRLVGFYVIAGSDTANLSGSVVIGNVRALVAGRQ